MDLRNQLTKNMNMVYLFILLYFFQLKIAKQLSVAQMYLWNKLLLSIYEHLCRTYLVGWVAIEKVELEQEKYAEVEM